MKFCCRTTHEVATIVIAIHFALGGQFKSNSFWDGTVGQKSEHIKLRCSGVCVTLLKRCGPVDNWCAESNGLIWKHSCVLIGLMLFL